MKRARNHSDIIWLIDGAYVLRGATGTIDYVSLQKEMEECVEGQFDQVIFFNSAKKGDTKQEGFHRQMRKQGFDVRVYKLKELKIKCPHCSQTSGRQVQAGVDVGICTTMLELMFSYSRIVLTAGDGDFIDAIDIVKKNKKEVYISGFKNSMSKHFHITADKIKFLDI